MNFKNIIFDFGNTIIKFDPYYMFDAFFKDEKEKREEFVREIFSREYWDKLDEGTLSTDEYYKLLTGKIPEAYHEKLYNICFGWYKECPYIEGMVELIKKLKKDGYKIYLLSNILKEFAESFEKDIFEITVLPNNRLHFIFEDKSEITTTWEQPSRRDSWTAEMKEAARQQTLSRKRGDALSQEQ